MRGRQFNKKKKETYAFGETFVYHCGETLFVSKV